MKRIIAGLLLMAGQAYAMGEFEVPGATCVTLESGREAAALAARTGRPLRRKWHGFICVLQVRTESPRGLAMIGAVQDSKGRLICPIEGTWVEDEGGICMNLSACGGPVEAFCF